jgi:hypothetical protein
LRRRSGRDAAGGKAIDQRTTREIIALLEKNPDGKALTAQGLWRGHENIGVSTARNN